MNIKVKILTSILFISILFLTFGGILSFAVTEAKVEATVSYKELSANNEVIVTIAIKDFQNIGDGINAYILTINFDKNKLAFVKAEGLNGWNSPTYNGNNLENGKIKFVATRSNFSKETGEILKITLKTKDNVIVSDLNQIGFEGVSFANKINNSTQKLQVGKISLNVLDLEENNGQSETPEPEKQPETPEPEKTPSKQPETNTDDNKEEVPKGPLPQTGIGSYIILFVALITSVFVFYRKYKEIEI